MLASPHLKRRFRFVSHSPAVCPKNVSVSDIRQHDVTAPLVSARAVNSSWSTKLAFADIACALLFSTTLEHVRGTEASYPRVRRFFGWRTCSTRNTWYLENRYRDSSRRAYRLYVKPFIIVLKTVMSVTVVEVQTSEDARTAEVKGVKSERAHGTPLQDRKPPPPFG